MTATPFTTRDDGPAVEQQIVGDMFRRALPAVPVILVLSGLVWGLHGALSSAYAIALVVANFALSASLLAWTARISLSLMMATALAGYLVRLALVSLAILLVKDQSWVELVPLCLTLVLTHLGLLAWETRFVSASLAFPALKPRRH